jgi:alpha-ketoglutarate-dependent taurine dioxygenase
LRKLPSELLDKGYIRLKAISVAEPTLEIALRVGSPSLISEVSPVQGLVPRAADQASPSSYGGIYGLGEFPLHTDMAHWYVPPRFFLLRCVQPAPAVKTLVLHSRFAFADEDEMTLRRALFRPRRRLDGRLTSLRLVESGICRWDPVFIVPITKNAIQLRERVLRRLEAARIEELALNDPTDCIVIDNWAALHGRTSVPLSCVYRKMERVYLDSVDL